MPIDINIISAGIGLLLTLIIFSYLIGDNPLFRMAVYIFVGVSAGYAATVVVYYVFIPRFVDFPPLNDPSQFIFAALSMALGISLIAKFLPRTSWIGNFAMAVLVGVGAAAAIGGALLGTVIPQLQSAINAFDTRSLGIGRVVFEGGIMLVGTVFTLTAFHFSAGRAADGTPKRPRLLELAAWAGRIFVAITLGVIFAGVYAAALTAMIERLNFIIIDFPSVIRQLLTGS